MSLNPPLLLTGYRTLREAGATGKVESPSELSSQLRVPCSLASSLTASASLKDATHWTAYIKS
ncbi:hypothetical protein LC653_04230 [Nostoc sp. CHAB 5784]|nr:hypothetical protein [Nostoc mirabile]MCC5663163.1 hypothetical protein [Nostoc mirabile CHAB5784]